MYSLSEMNEVAVSKVLRHVPFAVTRGTLQPISLTHSGSHQYNYSTAVSYLDINFPERSINTLAYSGKLQIRIYTRDHLASVSSYKNNTYCRHLNIFYQKK